MGINVTLKNYRCFPDDSPARFCMRPGVTAFIGPNSSGKSSILRFFYEFRNLFQTAAQPLALLPALQSGQGFTPAAVSDIDEVFSDSNDRGIEIEVEVKRDGGETQDPTGVPYADRLRILFPRNATTWTGQLFAGGALVPIQPNLGLSDTYFVANGANTANVSDLLEACRQLGSTLYIGPFRNALNLGTFDSYFDIQAGQAFINRWRSFQTGTNNFYKRMVYRITLAGC
jgi:AAA ATPase domain